MSKVLEKQGFRFFFFSGEGQEKWPHSFEQETAFFKWNLC
jgi:hypothetical protein